MTRLRGLALPAAALASGAALACAFPPVGVAGIAWVGLVPLLLICRFTVPRRAAWLGFLFGTSFWLVALGWLLRIAETGCPILECPGIFAVAGWAVLALCCATYISVFAWACATWFARLGCSDWRLNIGFMAFAASAWVFLEYLRGILLSGFAWNGLAVSQYMNPVVCQWASWGGIYAVSGLLVAVNAGIAVTVLNLRGVHLLGRYRTHPELTVTLVVTAAALWNGITAFTAPRLVEGSLSVAAVQPNIPQVNKWSPEWVEYIYARVAALTREAVREPVDLVLWPETALPSYALADPECLAFVDDLLTNGVPILAGSMDARRNGLDEDYYVCAMLFQEGSDVQIYDKRHLVPIGEYIPLADTIPALGRLVPLGWTCKPGTRDTVVYLEEPHRTGIGCLICFEDVFPDLSRKSVANGARLLVVQSNDAWYDPSCGSLQHMAHCVFRCIENGVPAVRVTNTGITCVIDSRGAIARGGEAAFSIEGGARVVESLVATLVEGVLRARVEIPPADMPATFYTRHGDLFAWVCGLFSIATIVVIRFRRQKR